MVSRSPDFWNLIICLEVGLKRYYVYPIKYDLLSEKVLLGFFSRLQRLVIHLLLWAFHAAARPQSPAAQHECYRCQRSVTVPKWWPETAPPEDSDLQDKIKMPWEVLWYASDPILRWWILTRETTWKLYLQNFSINKNLAFNFSNIFTFSTINSNLTTGSLRHIF